MSVRVVYAGTTEYITVPISSAVTLDTQPVAIAFHRAEDEDGDWIYDWLNATWIGTAGTTRLAQLLLTPSNTPIPGSHPIFVKVTDNPEIPVILAGTLEVW